jgi:tRNA pseudouridine13 synthase
VTGDEVVLKHRPADFLVKEVLVTEQNGDESSPQRYLLLRKAGYTTMEAVRLIAERFGLPSTEITYAGLKDEDGVTEQLVAVPTEPTAAGWGELGTGSDRWMTLTHSGFGATPLRVGRLEGNAFRVVVRNLSERLALALGNTAKINHFFLNYYDTQRFGVPGGPKRTHLVGQAILDGRWDVARRELIDLGAPESRLAQRWQGKAEQFFRELDPRNAAFYLAAHASARWNAELREIVTRIGGADRVDIDIDGLPYTYLASARQVHQVLGAASELPYQRFSFHDGEITSQSSPRPTVVQTVVAVEEPGPDEFRPGRFRAGLSFFLPSGCYATAAVRQLIGLVTHREPAGR